MTTRRLTEPPHQGPAALERGPELVERGAQWGASSTQEPQPAWSLLQQDQGHRGEYFCWWVVSELKSWRNTMIFHILRIQYRIYQNNIKCLVLALCYEQLFIYIRDPLFICFCCCFFCAWYVTFCNLSFCRLTSGANLRRTDNREGYPKMCVP